MLPPISSQLGHGAVGRDRTCPSRPCSAAPCWTSAPVSWPSTLPGRASSSRAPEDRSVRSSAGGSPPLGCASSCSSTRRKHRSRQLRACFGTNWVRERRSRPRRHQEPLAGNRASRAASARRGPPRRRLQAGASPRIVPRRRSGRECPRDEEPRRRLQQRRRRAVRPVLHGQGGPANEHPRPDEARCRVDRCGRGERGQRALRGGPPGKRDRLGGEHRAGLPSAGRGERPPDRDGRARDAVSDDHGRGRRPLDP